MKNPYLYLVPLLVLLYCCNQLKDNNKKLPRPYYWNQQQVDSFSFMVYQPRHLQFKVSADRPELLQQQAFLLNNDVRCFEDDGSFKEKLYYGGSKVQLSMPPDHLATPNNIKDVYYLWYHPRQWFKSMNLHVYNDSLTVIYHQDSTKTWVDIELFYPKRLDIEEIYLGHSSILGSTVYNRNYEKQHQDKISQILIKEKGYIKVRTDIFTFVDEWGNFYNEPASFKVRSRFTFTVGEKGIKTQKSSKKDPVFKAKKYGPAKFGRGNYQGDIPDLTPYYKIRVNASERIIMYQHYISEKRKKQWSKKPKGGHYR